MTATQPPVDAAGKVRKYTAADLGRVMAVVVHLFSGGALVGWGLGQLDRWTGGWWQAPMAILLSWGLLVLAATRTGFAAWWFRRHLKTEPVDNPPAVTP